MGGVRVAVGGKRTETLRALERLEAAVDPHVDLEVPKL